MPACMNVVIIGSGSTPLSLLSSRSQLTGKPHNPLSTPRGEATVIRLKFASAAVDLHPIGRCGLEPLARRIIRTAGLCCVAAEQQPARQPV